MVSQVITVYLNRETLKKDRFIQNIFSEDPNVKMHKIGGLVSYREDGAIAYHGRMDNQIKLSGLRIELSEMEKILRSLQV